MKVYVPLIVLMTLLGTVCGCGRSAPPEARRQLQELDPNPQVDASAAAQFISIESTTAERMPPDTLLTITCTVLKEGVLVAEWPSTGGETESVELVPQPDATGNAVLVINPVRCLKGQKVTIRPKEG
ncbi:MAG: hypothetical protein V2A58_10000 [Planctomycetota bacterium]